MEQSNNWKLEPDGAFFFSTRGDYGCFSNFSRHPLVLKEKFWPTSEHFYQAQKLVGTEHEERIRQATSPKIAAQIGRDPSLPLRADWEAVKEDVMMDALRAKFSQNSECAKTLIQTGDGSSGTGKNRLGVLLMRLRKELQNR